MADDSSTSINIQLNDQIPSSIAIKIKAIADAARDGDAAVARLRAQITGLDGGTLDRISASVDAQAKAYLSQEAALNKAVTAETRAQIAQVQLEASTVRLTKAQLSLNAAQSGGATAAEKTLSAIMNQAATVGKTAAEMAEYRAAQAGITVEAAPYIAKLKEAETAAGGLALGTHRAATETIVLIREAARGNFSRMASSGSILAQNLTLIGFAAVGVVLALGGVALAAFKGEEEISKINNAIKASGDYAGITAGSYKVMQKEIAEATGQGLSPANAALMTLVSSGKIGSDTLKLLATDSVNLAHMTGESADKVAQDFLKMTDGVTKYAIEFNSKYHMLDTAQVDYIRQLEAMGQKEEAEKAFAQDVFTSIQQKGVEQLGILQRAVRATEDSFSHFWEYLKSIGRDATMQEQIATLQSQIASLNASVKSASSDPVTAAMNAGGIALSEKKIAALKAELEWRQKILANEDAGAAMRASEARVNQEGIDASARLNGEWEKYAKNTNAADEAIKRFRADLAATLAVNPNDTKGLQDKANQAAVEARIRKAFDPVGAGDAKKAAAEAERRSVTMDALNTKLRDQLSVLTNVGNKSKEQTDWDTIQVEMIRRKITLTNAETKAIKDNLSAQANARRENDLTTYIKQIQDTTANLKLNSDERRVQEQLDRAQAAEVAKGNGPFSPQQIDRMRQALMLQQQIDAAARVKDAANDNAKGAVDSIATQLATQHQYEENAAAMYARIDNLRKLDVLNEQQAAQAKAQYDNLVLTERLANTQSFFGQMATLQNNGNQVLASIGKAAAVAQATIDGILAVQKALASFPPPFSYVMAAAVGITAAANVAQIAGIKFANGGLVRGPGGPRDDRVHAQLSNGEFVVNAKATKENRAILEAINDNRLGVPKYADGGYVQPQTPQGYIGGVVQNTYNSQGGGNLVIENHGTQQTYQRVPGLTPDEVRYIARDVVHTETPNIMSAQVADPNSKFSRSSGRHTTLKRKRNGL